MPSLMPGRPLRMAATCSGEGGGRESAKRKGTAKSSARRRAAAAEMRLSVPSGMTRRIFFPLIAALALPITLMAEGVNAILVNGQVHGGTRKRKGSPRAEGNLFRALGDKLHRRQSGRAQISRLFDSRPCRTVDV